jgi:hypothetical protein
MDRPAPSQRQAGDSVFVVADEQGVQRISTFSVEEVAVTLVGRLDTEGEMGSVDETDALGEGGFLANPRLDLLAMVLLGPLDPFFLQAEKGDDHSPHP